MPRTRIRSLRPVGRDAAPDVDGRARDGGHRMGRSPFVLGGARKLDSRELREGREGRGGCCDLCKGSGTHLQQATKQVERALTNKSCLAKTRMKMCGYAAGYAEWPKSTNTGYCCGRSLAPHLASLGDTEPSIPR